MSGSDVEYIKEGLTEVKETLKELTHNINDLRVLVAGEYVKKEEFKEHLKTEASNRWKIAGLTITISGLIFTVIQWIFTLKV